MNAKLSLNEFTESVAGMIEYNKETRFTNENEYKQLLRILTKVIAGELTPATMHSYEVLQKFNCNRNSCSIGNR